MLRTAAKRPPSCPISHRNTPLLVSAEPFGSHCQQLILRRTPRLEHFADHLQTSPTFLSLQTLEATISRRGSVARSAPDTGFAVEEVSQCRMHRIRRRPPRKGALYLR
jgi:hypothetical protein